MSSAMCMRGMELKLCGGRIGLWVMRYLPDDDDFDDGIVEKKRLVGNELGDGVRMLDSRRQDLQGRGKRGSADDTTTLFVNAALMGDDEGGELKNLPWVVELEWGKADLDTKS